MTIQSLAFSLDANQDGAYSAWELWEVCKALYHLPGNLVVEALGQLPIAQHFLHIEASAATGYGSLNGTLAIALSLAFWVAILFTVLTVASPTDPESLQQPTETTPSGTNVQGTSLGSQTLHNHHVHAASLHEHAAMPRRGLAAKAATVPRDRMHLPVSRTYYAAPGRKPVRKRYRPHLNPNG
jgi:hypothetical protein